MNGLRRKDHFDEKLGALNPNISLPNNIATRILDSPYFTRLLGNDLAEAHSLVEEKKDDARVVERHAAENNVPCRSCGRWWNPCVLPLTCALSRGRRSTKQWPPS